MTASLMRFPAWRRTRSLDRGVPCLDDHLIHLAAMTGGGIGENIRPIATGEQLEQRFRRQSRWVQEPRNVFTVFNATNARAGDEPCG